MDKIRKSPASPKPPPHNLKINIYDRQKDLPLEKLPVRKALRELLGYLQILCDAVSVYFVSKKKICELHNQFFSDPTPTDCITFPMDDSHLGEIFICPATAISYAKKRGIDPYRETLLYLIHGILHLVGYSDLDPADRKAMRKMERSCMDHLIKRGISLGSVST
jgi:probable rRNA maturation factor